MLERPNVYSPYYDGVDRHIVASQSNVFRTLGIPLVQDFNGGRTHGQWLDHMARTVPSPIAIFCDIDAFPLSRSAYERAVSAAAAGRIFGLAQSANHLPHLNIYAGPMFVAFRRDIYEALGAPTFCHSNDYDVGQLLSIRAREKNIPIELVYPTSVIRPQWALADRGVFGVGTFYGENEFFHLFEARRRAYIDLFVRVAEDAQAGQLRFSDYLAIAKSDDVAKRSRFRRFLKERRRAIRSYLLNKLGR